MGKATPTRRERRLTRSSTRAVAPELERASSASSARRKNREEGRSHPRYRSSEPRPGRKGPEKKEEATPAPEPEATPAQELSCVRGRNVEPRRRARPHEELDARAESRLCFNFYFHIFYFFIYFLTIFSFFCFINAKHHKAHHSDHPALPAPPEKIFATLVWPAVLCTTQTVLVLVQYIRTFFCTRDLPLERIYNSHNIELRASSTDRLFSKIARGMATTAIDPPSRGEEEMRLVDLERSGFTSPPPSSSPVTAACFPPAARRGGRL